jgi:hypothetical protein
MLAGRIRVVCLMLSLSLGLMAQDLKPEEIVAKHLSSVGTAEKRRELKNMMLLGSSQFESKLPERKSVGKVAIVSTASNLLFISSFAAENYPYEKIGVFDGKVNIPFVVSGVRSPLGEFLWDNQNILKSGLFSGTMSLRWALSSENLKKGKMQLVGTKKLDGRKVHVLQYFPSDSSDALNIRLFFDAETFQHLRTQYLEVIANRQTPIGTFGQSGSFETQLVEDFSDFKTFEGITLPTRSKVHYSVLSSKGTYEYDWVFQINDVKFNQTLKENFFNFN